MERISRLLICLALLLVSDLAAACASGEQVAYFFAAASVNSANSSGTRGTVDPAVLACLQGIQGHTFSELGSAQSSVRSCALQGGQTGKEVLDNTASFWIPATWGSWSMPTPGSSTVWQVLGISPVSGNPAQQAGQAQITAETTCNGVPQGSDGNACSASQGATSVIAAAQGGNGVYYCVGGCQQVAVGVGLTNGTQQDFRSAATGKPCGNTDGQATTLQQSNVHNQNGDGPGVCEHNASGNLQTCIVTGHDNCGTVNGTEVCIASLTPDNPCVKTPSGAGVCLNASPASKKPDNGTPGQPAPPSSQVQPVDPSGGQRVPMDVYDPSTVANCDDCDGTLGTSTGASTGGSTGGTTGGSGGGGGTGNSLGGTGGTTGTSTSGDTCTGDGCSPDGSQSGFDGGDGEDVCDFGDCVSDFYQRVSASPIGQAAAQVSGAVPSGGELPTGEFQAFNRSFTFAVPQQIVDNIRPVLQSVMLAVWAITAIFIFLRA